MGSFPTASIPDPAAFTRQLLEDVMDLDPSFHVLESACRKLRKSKKFIPSISEVIEAIEAEDVAWDRRGDAFYVEEVHRETTELLDAELKRREAAKQAEQKRRDEISAARALPICVGDRVRHPKGGNGTVAEIFSLHELGEQGTAPTMRLPHPDYLVDFDKHGKRTVFSAASLERLAKCEEADAVPGEGNADNGFSRP